MKSLVTLFILLATVGSAFAQSSFKPGAGLNFTGITGTGDDVKGKMGWQVGASVELGNKFYIEPGIFYTTRNAESTTINDGVSSLSDAQFRGFRVPVAVGYNILGNTNSSFAFRVFGGGSAFILSSVSDGYAISDFNNPEWGVFAGLGADISIIFIDLSYQWSLTNVQKNIPGIDLGRTNGVFLTAGFRF
ncbi:outer membrane beta-barrel protein [Aquiflexum sp. LQ15W]|uniref:outer membrane beta-barrel protein n=1 Tax=Cognataquiflexum nitidum TaxID=2922272 RepID=UPI001F133FB1|nr:outer membrane beta-barrel protein [Cognataquiflexum nitidum]MCH6198131.1 outer membrane beta-barrel protein [Cognataquiflexum nitidum]